MASTKEKRPVGRPPTKYPYSRKLARRILLKIARSRRGLNYLNKRYDWFPSESRIFKWLEDKPEFAAGYARARRAQAARYANEQICIADDSPCNTGPEQMKAKLRCESRRWAASRLAPRDWGDKIEVAGDQDRPLVSWKELFDLAEGKD